MPQAKAVPQKTFCRQGPARGRSVTAGVPPTPAGRKSGDIGEAALQFVQRGVNCAVRYRDWRRGIAALLGRFLPRLGPHLGAALFSMSSGRTAAEAAVSELPHPAPRA